MKNFIGIDLGTTNSAIASFDGKDVRIWKSPEQNDVTPSAIYIDRRGNRFIGKRAYDQAPYDPTRSALLFKRLMGTSTPINLTGANIVMTPEECSAEVLKTLYGYLPEEIRNDPETGTVITVPAAFNQMQKDATLQAAQKAGLGKVALMQEPVAAVMSVMRQSKNDGMFLIFDLGGGTLDIAIAESMGGRVSLLSHGGIQMCGGRDFDRALLDNVIKPWIEDTFALPFNFAIDPQYRSFMRLAAWAAEKAKIELSSREEAVISLSETEARTLDENDEDMYLDIPITRQKFDSLIEDRLASAIDAARDSMQKAGLSPTDLERIVFVGGPTNYSSLREKVCFELGLQGSTEVNPMTAVAEGASIFAESIDWSKDDRSRKSTRGSMVLLGKLDLSFNYIARTPESKTKLVVKINTPLKTKAEYEVVSQDTGWTSGRMALQNGAMLNLSLPNQGENHFKVMVYDELGHSMSIPENTIVICRTAATVDAIPASHSIAVEVVGKLGGKSNLDFLVRAGDTLPKKGKKIFKSAESLRAGSDKSLNIKLWEGDIQSPVYDNRAIGVLKISGADFDEGIIPAGADLECNYEVTDSGNILLEVAVPCIGSIFKSDRNFYSRQEGQLDFSKDEDSISFDLKETISRADTICEVVDDKALNEMVYKLSQSQNKLKYEHVSEEELQEIQEQILDCKKVMSKTSKNNQKLLNQSKLDAQKNVYQLHLKEHLSFAEQHELDNLFKVTQQAIDLNNGEFDSSFTELHQAMLAKLWNQKWYVVGLFNDLSNAAKTCSKPVEAMDLVNQGLAMLDSGCADFIEFRQIVFALFVCVYGGHVEKLGMADVANIMRG